MKLSPEEAEQMRTRTRELVAHATLLCKDAERIKAEAVAAVTRAVAIQDGLYMRAPLTIDLNPKEKKDNKA